MYFDDATFLGLYAQLEKLTLLGAGQWDSISVTPGAHQIALHEQLTDPKVQRSDLTLRIDPTLGVVSGDVMASQAGHWRFSFMSEAVFRFDHSGASHLVVLADCFPSPGFLPKGDLELKALLAISFDDAGEVSEARLAALEDRGTAARRIVDLRSNGKGTAERSFRQIQLRAAADADLVYDDFYGPLLEDVVGERRGTNGIIPKLADIGLGVTGDTVQAMEFPGPGAATSKGNVQPDNILTAYSRLSRLQFAKHPFLYSLLFAKHSRRPADLGDVELDDQERQRRLVFGTAVGLDSGIRRYRNRFGALVLPVEIARSYLEYLNQKEGHPAIDEEILRKRLTDPKDGEAKTIRERIRQRIEHTAIHELGHLLNLPHPWQRDRFPGARHGADPAAKSWMNYTTRYPFGAANELAFGQHAAEQARWKRYDYSETVMDAPEHLGDMCFSKAEQLHLRHAPFDEIAVGQKSFVDGLRSAPAIQSPGTGQRKLTLELLEELDSNPETGSNTYVSSDYTDMRPSESRRPVIGTVSVPVSAFPDEFHDHMQFGFGAGALRLVIEGRPDDPYAKPITRIYDAPFLLDENRSIALDKQIQSTKSLPDNGGEEVFLASLPILPPEFLFHGFAPRSRFRLQAVFLPPRGSPIGSNVINLRYNETNLSKAVGDAALPEVMAILGSSELPLLWDAVHFLTDLEKDASAGFRSLIARIEAFDLSTVENAQEVEWLRVLAAAIRVQRNAGPAGPVSEEVAAQGYTNLDLLPVSVLSPLLISQRAYFAADSTEISESASPMLKLPPLAEIRQMSKRFGPAKHDHT